MGTKILTFVLAAFLTAFPQTEEASASAAGSGVRQVLLQAAGDRGTPASARAAEDSTMIRMVNIPGGSFWMGSNGLGEDYDEAPVHQVTVSSFRMSRTEITNAQYEAFRPEHRALRGKDNVSTEDDEAVVNVSWQEAMDFCAWLSEKEGRSYRLPTEAEWEYACRAGTYTLFWTGDGLPDEFHKNQTVARDFDPVSLKVGQTQANAFGLCDMHGNVEEWCLDWYGEYSCEVQSNPCGPEDGLYRVSRGGSHHTPEKFLRSANRMAMIPEDRHSQTGFRIVESDTPLNFSGTEAPVPMNMSKVRQHTEKWKAVSADEPVFMAPIPFVIKPECDSGTPFYRHNHQPALTWCDNGDLLAIWFSADAENGREMVVLGSRMRKGRDEWDPASLFFKVPDRNMTGSALLNDGNGKLYHFNGVEASGDWQNLAVAMRTSTDNGATWSRPRLIAPEHARRHQIIAGTLLTREGWIVQACDAGPGSHDGAAVEISRDGGETWSDPWDGAPLPAFAEDGTGTTIAGIHAGIVQLADGSLMAMGRGNSIIGEDGKPHMPMSISMDMGRTWTYHASGLPPIDGGQRLVLMRLKEGPLLIVSFTGHPQRTPEADRGMEFTDSQGNAYTGYGMYAALSYDDGKTWPVRKLMTDGKYRFLDGGAWTGFFEMDAAHAEPRGYLAGTQTPDGMIHILSSRLHYRFNLAWILS